MLSIFVVVRATRSLLASAAVELIEFSYQLMQMVCSLSNTINSTGTMCWAAPYHSHRSLAIKHKINVVTTSYVSDAMRELDGPAKEAGVVVLNEVGADPGVDHLYPIKKLRRYMPLAVK